jgi:hypothetical protein
MKLVCMGIQETCGHLQKELTITKISKWVILLLGDYLTTSASCRTGVITHQGCYHLPTPITSIPGHGKFSMLSFSWGLQSTTVPSLKQVGNIFSPRGGCTTLEILVFYGYRLSISMQLFACATYLKHLSNPNSHGFNRFSWGACF